MADTSIPQFVVPGRTLGPASKYVAGPGTHVYGDSVVASLLGHVRVTPAKTPQKQQQSAAGPPKRLTRITQPSTAASRGEEDEDSRPTLSVARADKKREVLPEVGNLVLCKVVRLMPRQAIVSIRQVEATVLETEWQGVIRVQDVRATEKDKVKIQESFKPGDVVRAEVISLGDQANYYLSTAKNELGVVIALSDAGNDMVPVSWKEFRDPETGLGELRKVAKPR